MQVLMTSAQIICRSILVMDLDLIFSPMKALKCKICLPLAGLHPEISSRISSDLKNSCL